MNGHLTRRILRHYDAATDAHRAEGAAWYATARAASASMAGDGITAEQAAAIVAALSPRVSWSVNVRAARAMVDAARAGLPEPVVAGLGSNRRKAWRIALGEEPTSVLSGPKVTAFYASIIGDDDAVTVDVWACWAAEGRRNPDAPRGARYRRIADAYRRAARRRGITPREMQATVWCAVRGGGSTVSTEGPTQ